MLNEYRKESRGLLKRRFAPSLAQTTTENFLLAHFCGFGGMAHWF
jgi:hypothetical protein